MVVKLPSIVSEHDSFFFILADIKGEGTLALLAAPSYVHVYSPLQVRQQPFSYLGGGAGIFIVLVIFFSEPSSVKPLILARSKKRIKFRHNTWEFYVYMN
jgi:hypothetical protein